MAWHLINKMEKPCLETKNEGDCPYTKETHKDWIYKQTTPYSITSEVVRDDFCIGWTDKFKGKEKCMTFLYGKKSIAFLNEKEWKTQLAHFKKSKCNSEMYNLREFKCESWNNKKASGWLVVIQRDDMDVLCPLGMALGMLVSGITYCFRTKKEALEVVKFLSASK